MQSEGDVSRTRRVIWRYEFPLTSIAVLFAAVLAITWATGLVELPGLVGASVVAGFLAGCYLLGPCAYVTVRASEVVVANTSLRFWIPRESIREVAGWEWESVAIYLLDGRRIPVGALQSFIAAKSPRSYRQRAMALERALREVPAVVAGGALRRRVRYGHIVLVVFTLAAFGAPLVFGL